MRRASPVIALIALLLAQTGAHADLSLETMLVGKWRVFWISEGRVSSLTIDSVAPQGKVTNFSGSIVQGEENCRMMGNVVATSQLDYTEGLISTEIIIPAIVNISATCTGLTMKMEALGLSDSEYLMSGRAIVKVNGGTQLMLPVALAPAR